MPGERRWQKRSLPEEFAAGLPDTMQSSFKNLVGTGNGRHSFLAPLTVSSSFRPS